MSKILRGYGIRNKLVSAIKCMYNGSTSKVRIGNDLSRSFQIETGMLYGDTLAPFLFIVVLDYVLTRATASGLYGVALLGDL